MLTYSQTTFENKIKAKAEQIVRQKALNEQSAKLVGQGSIIFKQLCFTCHGADAKGVFNGGVTSTAPPLAGNADVNNMSSEKLIRILLYGLSGPIRGTAYTDVMPALGGNDNAYIASVLSYIRSDFGNKAPVVLPEDVQRIRDATVGRTNGYTMAELDTIKPLRRRR
jgi:mono/diheme cytochrome c family protein